MTRVPQPARSAALDVFRATAVLCMIQGHVFTALLRTDALGLPPPRWYTLLHGLTAPMFLLGAGCAYGVSKLRAPAQSFTAALRTGLRRPALLWLLGTYMQLPGGSLIGLARSPEARQGALAVGPLQLIAACLVWAELTRALSPDARTFRRAMAALSALVVALAPWVWTTHASLSLPVALGVWLDGARGSPFPLFPWAAFFGVGVALAPALRCTTVRRGSAWCAFGGLAMALAFARHGLAGPHASGAVYWHAGANYFVFRAGACAVVLGVLVVLDASVLRGRTPAALALLSRHSLTAYVAHLVLLYGSPITRGLTRQFAGASVPQVSALTALVLLASFAACYLVSLIAKRKNAPPTAHFAPAGTPGS